MVLKIVLESFPGRSFKKTWISGMEHPRSCTASRIKATAERALSPEEQPRSATFNLTGLVLEKRVINASSINSFVFVMIDLYKASVRHSETTGSKLDSNIYVN